MKFLFVLNILLALFSSAIYAQINRLSGTIINKETQTPVPEVSIFTKDNQTGTISTTKGKFSLEIPVHKTNEYLYFTSIEYEADSILISEAKSPLLIQLTSKVYSLKEVYIMPDSTLLTLLRKAYSKIPDNYPDQPTRYKGFFQESTSNEKDSLMELIELELSVYKESYLKKREAPGQVEILKSRIKQFQDPSGEFGGIVGGAFLPVSGDIVLQRVNYIQPQHLKHYQYDFTGIKTWNGKDCYEIEFHPQGKNSSGVRSCGKMLIDMETLAYVLFEIQSENKENAKTWVGIIEPVEKKVKIVYEQFNDRWYLKRASVKHKHEHWRLKNPLYSSYDFITTQIQTESVKPIPVINRLEEMDLVEAKTEAYNPDGWTDSDMLSNENMNQLGFQFSTDESSSIFKQKVRQKPSFRKTMIKTLPKLIIGYGICYDPGHELIVSQSVLGYRFNKKWNIQGRYTEDFYDKKISLKEVALGVEFRKNLNNAGYPVLLGTSFWISDSRFHNRYDYVRKQAISPQLSLYKRMNQFFSLELFVNYPVIIHSNTDHHSQMKGGINVYLF